MHWLKLASATWRLTYMLKYERGLFGLAESLRGQVSDDSEAGQALDCFFCFSVWCALIVVLLDWICPVLVDVLALSGGAIALDRWNNS